MMKTSYHKQAALLLSVLPEVAKESCFALHGGTAINLFVRDMPRVSVDIDLTYLPIEDRETSLTNIGAALGRIKDRVEKVLRAARVEHDREKQKLRFSQSGTLVKLEVNLVGRGALETPEERTLCLKGQEEFDAFCTMPVVPLGQLYGGKICAALDRQHPRDLFDVSLLLENEGFTDDIKTGFLLCLLSGDRPIHETIRPNLLDQSTVMVNQFEGMTDMTFTYDDFEDTRERMIMIIHDSLTDDDRDFLLSVKSLTPDWSIYDFERFPAVQWKLRNLENLKARNPGKHTAQLEALRKKLNGSAT